MTSPTVGHLRVDGADLRYEVRGSGPLLLLIPGGTGGASSFDGVAGDLAGEYTVVTYDPRGLTRSPLDDPEARQSVAQHADDAFRLLELLSPGEPALVAGCSSGAIVALHLLVTHPERVLRVVAHEPPVVEVLPDAADHRALLARVDETFRTEGLMPAAALFAAGLRRPGDEPPTPEPAPAYQPASEQPAARPEAELPPEAAGRAERTMADMPYFLGRIVPSFMAYTPDVERLHTLSDRLVLAAGEESRGELPYRPAAFLADLFGTELVHFPGGHVGLTTHPAEFGALLRKVLTA
ncbi:alpha/beta hydrolase [Nonomuraea monospora]|uniref:Alpha/beta hydrolase n=1 Tax=Nonomuraea monospora TaxID=568818 RepID=A0ABN3D2Q5_9ACTN